MKHVIDTTPDAGPSDEWVQIAHSIVQGTVQLEAREDAKRESS